MALDTAQAIRNAIEAEKAAQRFYEWLSEATEDPDAQAFLSDMALAETAHAEAIEDQGRVLFRGPLPDYADSIVEVIETVPDWRLVEDVSFEEALDIAYTAEIAASLYYDAIADGLQGEAQKFFRELARTEEEHGRRVRELQRAARDEE